MLQVVKMEAGDLPAATNVVHYVPVMDVIKLQEDVLVNKKKKSSIFSVSYCFLLTHNFRFWHRNT
jgi:hypothetical protein